MAPTTRRRFAMFLGLGVLFIAAITWFAWTALAASDEVQLQRFSDIGQAFGAVSAILSAVALLGIAASLYYQMQQTRAAQVTASRGMRMHLLQIALENPRYLNAWGINSDDDAGKAQEYAYISMVLAYSKTSYMLGVSTDYELRMYCRAIFEQAEIRNFWRTVRQTYLHDHFADARRFARIVDEVYTHATAGSEQAGGQSSRATVALPEGGTLDDDQRKRWAPSQSVVLSTAAAGALAVAAAVVLAKSTRRRVTAAGHHASSQR